MKRPRIKKFISSIFILLISSLLLSCQSTPTHNYTGPNGVQYQTGSKKVPIMAKTSAPQTGMVAAANPHAVKAGLEILEQGGSAVDAAIAVQATLGLVEPQSSGLGGGAFMVVYDNKTGKVWSYDGREAAPSTIKPELFLDDHGKPLSYRSAVPSGRSTGVPGAVVMLSRAHDDYGRLKWGAQLEPAIGLAEQGFAISPRLAGLLKRAANFGFGNNQAVRDYFFALDGKTPHPEGYVLKNPKYAQTLRALQENPRALLEPPIANEILATVHAAPLPGTLSLSDMRAYKAKKRPALCGPYRAYTVCSAQPPSSGGVAVLSILGILQNYDMETMGQSLEGWHSFIEASFLAYADRDQYVADDSFVRVDSAALLAPDYLKSRAALISLGHANDNIKAGVFPQMLPGTDATPDNPGTSHFTVIDDTGLTVSITTTVESLFGSQRMAAGFLLNNQLTDFSFKITDDQGRPIANAPAPGKRPRSSMSPVIVFGPEGQLAFTTGSPGGSSIIAYTAKTIIGMIDWGLNPQEAINLPNVIARNGAVRIEKDLMPAKILNGLEKLGHKVVRSKGEISGLHIIKRNKDGSLTGGADPRREGVALTTIQR